MCYDAMFARYCVFLDLPNRNNVAPWAKHSVFGQMQKLAKVAGQREHLDKMSLAMVEQSTSEIEIKSIGASTTRCNDWRDEDWLTVNDLKSTGRDSRSRDLSQSSATKLRYVGHLPPLVFRADFVQTTPKLAVEIRARATFTGCALELSSGFTKLWWSIDILPCNNWLEATFNADLSPERRIDTQRRFASQFILLGFRLAHAGRNPLLTAFCAGAQETDIGVDPQSLRIQEDSEIFVAFVDDDRPELAALLDGCNVRPGSGDRKEVRSSNLQASCLDEFTRYEKFVKNATFNSENSSAEFRHFADTRLGIDTGLYTAGPGLCWRMGNEELLPNAAVVGLSYRLGSHRGSYLEARKQPERSTEFLKLLRQTSAARELSRRLASEFAFQFEEKFAADKRRSVAAE